MLLFLVRVLVNAILGTLNAVIHSGLYINPFFGICCTL